MLWDAKLLRELASKDVVENYQTQDTKKAQSREALGGKLDRDKYNGKQCYSRGVSNVKEDSVCETPCTNLLR